MGVAKDTGSGCGAAIKVVDRAEDAVCKVALPKVTGCATQAEIKGCQLSFRSRKTWKEQ